MQYMLLIYDDETKMGKMSEADMQANMGEWMQFDQGLRNAVNVISGNALLPTNAATTVRKPSGKAVTSDGPFAETKEQLGGYYLIDVDNLDKAIEWAGKMPNVGTGGSVEVRPVMVFDQP